MNTLKSSLKCGVVAGIFFLTSLALSVQAKTITFADASTDNSHWNFPGYQWTNGNIKDETGTPNVESMSVTWDQNTSLLQSVSINLHSSTVIQDFDSLFINTDWDGEWGAGQWDDWDYFVHSGGDANVSKTYGSVPDDGLYQVSENYEYTTNKSGGRTDHPNGIDAGSLTYESDLTRSHTNGSYQILYDFSSLSIKLGDSFTFAYSPWCANDVVYGGYNGSEVPEPATMLLFGAGLIGLAGFRKKK